MSPETPEPGRPPGAPPASPPGRLPWLALGPGVFALALVLRLLPWPAVFTSRGLLPGGLADEYYHLRRIVYSVLRFPAHLSFDPYSNHPDGGHIHWPPGFDWPIAALARLLVGPDDVGAIEQVAAWVPALLGAATAVVVAFAGRRAFGWVGGLAAGLGLALLPASWDYSRLGMVDHHVAVALAAAALLAVGMAWLRAPRPGPGLGLGLGLALSLPLLVWPGFLLHAAVAQAATLLASLGAADRGAAGARMRSLALAHALGALVVIPFCVGPAPPQYGDWSPLVLSRFQPVWLGAATAVFGALAFLWSSAGRRGRGTTPLVRGSEALAVGGVGVALALALAPGLREALFYAGGWFAKAEEFQSHVAELQPLDPEQAVTRLSWLVLSFPLAWGALAWQAWRQRRPDLGFLLVFAAVFSVLTLQQNRFLNTLSVPYALVLGGALAEGGRWLAGRLAGGTAAGRIAWTAGALALLLALQPVGRYYLHHLRRGLQILEEPDRAFWLLPSGRRAQLGAAWWLARSTPPTRGYLDPTREPEYAVLTEWTAGHLFRYVAHRAMVQDNFGVYGGKENYQRAWQVYAATDEEAAVALLDRLGVRYVVAGRYGAGLPKLDAYAPDTLAYRMARLFGSAAMRPDAASGESVEIPALGRLRMVYHGLSAPGEALFAPPPELSIAVFERVEGARVVGRAEPGARVVARLVLNPRAGPQRIPRAGSDHVYEAIAVADAQGRYRLRLPYPTDRPFSDAVRAGGPYRLSGSGRRATLAVPESAVRKGGAVEGPDLRAEAAPDA